MYKSNQTYYRITGTKRPAHTPAGTPIKFKVIVSKYDSRENFTPLQAMDTARAYMYSQGFDHILMTQVDVKVNRHDSYFVVLDESGCNYAQIWAMSGTVPYITKSITRIL